MAIGESELDQDQFSEHGCLSLLSDRSGMSRTVWIGHLIPICAAPLIALGCVAGDAPEPSDPFAGLPDVPRYVVDSVPAVTIGRDPTDDDYAFQWVEAAGIVGDSLVVVFDSGLARVGVYGFDGRFRRWLVRRGEGPGEARAVADGGVLPDGTIWFYDWNNAHRLTSLDHDGNILSESRLPGDVPMPLIDTKIVGPDPDGAWWYSVADVDAPDRPGEPFRVPTEIRRVEPDGSVRTVWGGLGEERVSDGSAPMGPDGEPLPGGGRSGGLIPSFTTAPYGSSVLFAWTDSAFINRLDAEGGLRRWGAFEARRRPVPDRSADQIPRHYHEIQGLFVGTDSTVWAALHEESAWAFLGFDQEGPAALLTSPQTGRPHAFGDGWVLMSRFLPGTGEAVVQLHRVSPLGAPPPS